MIILKWFYTRAAAAKFGELEGWDSIIVTMNVSPPNRKTLVLQVLLKILKCVTEDCYGCRYDRPRETKHPCLDPWNDIIEYYEKNAVKLCDELKNYRTFWIEVQLSWHVSDG